MIEDRAFVAGFVLGLIIAGTIIALVVAVRRPTRHHTPIDWDERTYAPQVTTTITVNRRRNIEL